MKGRDLRAATSCLKKTHLMIMQCGVALLFCVGAVFCTSGCANVTVKKVAPGNNDSVEGVRFYRPAPYLMVSQASGESKQSNSSTPASAGSRSSPVLQFTIVWMPDLSQEYAIQHSAGLGSVEFNPTLENGWNLTGLNTKVDSKTSELLTAVAGLIPKAAAGGQIAAPGELSLKPGMYAFLFEQDQKSPNYGRLKGIDLAHPVFTIPQ